MATRRESLAQRRAAMGYTQESFAAHLGVERSTVARWERGVATPQPWNQPDISKALKISVDALVEFLATDSADVDIAPSALQNSAGPASVARIRAVSKEFQAVDRRLGGGVLYASVVRYLNTEIGPRLLDPSDGLNAAALFAAAASMTDSAGWMAHDGGHDSLARRYFDRAFRLATAANEQALAGNACASMAHLAIELDQADDALHLAAVGLDHARQAEGTTRLIARLYSMLARAFALCGDRHACTQALDAAERTLANGGGEAVAEWFDDASLASEAALCFLGLAELEEAEHHAREVVRLRSGDRVRSRAFGQLTLAKVLVEAGRPDEAASLGDDVCRLATTLSSVRVIHRLQELGNALASARSLPEVSTFLAALASLSCVTHEQEDQGVTWPV